MILQLNKNGFSYWSEKLPEKLGIYCDLTSQAKKTLPLSPGKTLAGTGGQDGSRCLWFVS